MHKSHIEKAKKIVKNEIKWREWVFRKDSMKQKKEVEEMKYVYTVLHKCEELLPDEQTLLFEVEP